MRKLLSLSAIIVVAFFIFLSLPSAVTLKTESHENERKGGKPEIKESIDWWTNARSNQETGIFDPADMQMAIEEANAMATTRDVTINWEEMGPDNIGGRTRSILYDKDVSGLIFMGSVSGGLWKSTNNGDSWLRVAGDFSNNAVTCITQAINGDLYYGTGEGFHDLGLNSPLGYAAPGFPGGGVWKSTDHGNTWSQLSATAPVVNSTTSDWAYVNKLAVSTTDASKIYAATNKGIKISKDGGTTWTNAGGIATASNAWDIKIGSDGVVHAVSANKYYRATSPNGDDFTTQMGVGGFPAIPQGRIEIGIAASNPSYVYAVIAETLVAGWSLYGMYKSTDGGQNWTLIAPGNSASFAPLGEQAGYDIALGISPTDPEKVFLGGQLSLFSYTPATGWVTLTNWFAEFFDPSIYIHPDMHAVVFNPTNPDQMLIGCDGGIYRTSNASATYPSFESLNRNYITTQPYSVDAKTTGEVIMGLQDNGCIYIDFNGNTAKAGREIWGGDAMTVEIAATNENAFFEEYFAGAVKRSSNSGTGGFSSFFDTRIDAGGTGFPGQGADWIAPFELSEQGNEQSFFALGTGSSGGNVWVTLGALNFSINPDWFRFPATTGVVTCLAFTPDGNTLFAGTSTGMMYRYSNLLAVRDSGKFKYPAINSAADKWSAVDSGISVASVSIGVNRYLRSIAVDRLNNNNIVVTAARYAATSYVWRSTDAMSTFTFSDITGNLPKMPVWSSCIDYVNPNLILVGTDLGVYSRDITTSDWVEQNTGFERVPVMRIVQVPYYGQTDYTYIAGFGRGVFKSGSLVGIKNIENKIGSFKIFPNPVSDIATINASIASGSDVAIKVYDLKGNLVYGEVNKNQTSGSHNYTINTNSLSNGTYLIVIEAGTSKLSE